MVSGYVDWNDERNGGSNINLGHYYVQIQLGKRGKFLFLLVLLVITDNKTFNSGVLVILFVGTECPNSC